MSGNNNLDLYRKKARRVFGLGDFGFPSMTNVESQFWTFFMTDVAMVPLGLMAIIQTITGAIELVMSPLYGVVISAVKPGRWGRYSTWMLVCPPFIVIAYLFQWFAFGNSTVNGVVIAVGYTISHFLWNAIWVANVSLLPILATNAEERVKLSSKRFTFNYAARVLASFYLVPMLGFFTAAAGLNLAYPLIALFASMLMLIGYTIVGKYASKVELTMSAGQQEGQEKRKIWGPMLKAFVGNPHLIALIVVDAARNVGSFVLASFNMYYFTYVVGSMAFFSTNMLIGTVCGLLGAYLARFTIKFMTNRTACIVFALISAGSLAVIMFFGESLAIYVVFNSLYQALTAAFQALLVPLYSETCTFAEWKTGADNSGVIMGMQQLGVKLGAIFKGVAVSISLSAAGYVAGMEATPALKAGILRGYFLFPGTAFIIGGLALLLFYKLTPARVEEMQKEIEARKQSAAN